MLKLCLFSSAMVQMIDLQANQALLLQYILAISQEFHQIKGQGCFPKAVRKNSMT
jgi:hypothetical protein